MTVRRTRQADRDIVAIYRRGVREFGDAQAERYHAGLSALFDLLAENPRIARERTNWTRRCASTLMVPISSSTPSTMAAF